MPPHFSPSEQNYSNMQSFNYSSFVFEKKFNNLASFKIFQFCPWSLEEDQGQGSLTNTGQQGPELHTLQTRVSASIIFIATCNYPVSSSTTYFCSLATATQHSGPAGHFHFTQSPLAYHFYDRTQQLYMAHQTPHDCVKKKFSIITQLYYRRSRIKIHYHHQALVQ